MKGVILAGGNGKRLQPLTVVTNKHLLPVYKKPMIFYPIETLVNAGIKDVLIITSAENIEQFYKLLGKGENWDINIKYEIQRESNGTGGALLCAKDFLVGDDVIVILGDNIVIENIKDYVVDFMNNKNIFDAKILVSEVNNPEKYGVVEVEGKSVTRLVEKPKKPFSNLVNTGIWMFKSEVIQKCENIKLSERNEYEMTDVLSDYSNKGKLSYDKIKGHWSDAGTFEQLYQATMMLRSLEDNDNKEVKRVANYNK